ncbi:hypothetical protein CYMTET_34017 [Cymbomonas tetramitiformis]|uniref:Uncharacterized protein n=1 Tax=Cymbomonas tetramitiformis TaxID=36881 RepID=A0AAE0FC51_9CHLO|nr:hypothetical protein CYMTET_34017 [Cymbomonas tetramitiformis]
MGNTVTGSKSSGYRKLFLRNLKIGGVDEVVIEAQFVPDSPFNRVSAIRFEDTLGLYAQMRDRILVSDTQGQPVYDIVRQGQEFILPEAAQSVACPAQSRPMHDRINWQFSSEEFKKYDEQRGPFTVDTCADKHNVQGGMEEYHSVEDSVCDHVLTGCAFHWNPPYPDEFIGQLLCKVLMDFAKDPAHTKFLLVLKRTPVKEQCYDVTKLQVAEPGRVWVTGTPCHDYFIWTSSQWEVLTQTFLFIDD